MRTLIKTTHMGQYASTTSEPIYQLIMLLPLLVAYELAAVAINFDTPFQLRNGADILVKLALHKLGIRGVVSFVLVVVLFVSLLIIAAFKKHKARLNVAYFPAMFAESTVYAFVVGIASARLTGILIGSNPFLAVGGPVTLSERLMIALGAGVYEELVFRALLITILLVVVRRLVAREEHAAIASVILSALLFSGFHYVGEFGEVFDTTTFVFRTVAGLILSAIYVTRGIGTTAWAHSLYDLFLIGGIL